MPHWLLVTIIFFLIFGAFDAFVMWACIAVNARDEGYLDVPENAEQIGERKNA